MSTNNTIDRRDFLKTSAGVAVAVAAASQLGISYASSDGKSSTKGKIKVSVNHEWGTLKDVMIGRMINGQLYVPEMTEGMKQEVDFIPRIALDKMAANKGKLFVDVFPDFCKFWEPNTENFVNLVTDLGIKVHRNESLPVSEVKKIQPRYFGLQLYMRDPVLVIGNKVIVTNLKGPWRRVERIAMKKILEDIKQNYDAEIIHMPEMKEGYDKGNIYLEGGDVLLNGYEIYVGNSGHASNKKGIDWLQETLGSRYKVHEIKQRPDFLHLDCAMALLNEKFGIICPDAITEKLPESLQDYEWVEATLEEAQVLGTNGCMLDRDTIITDDHHPRIAHELVLRGHHVIEIPYTQGQALGGGLRCSHHPLIRESKL